MAGRGGRADAGLGVRPAPRAGAGPTVIAAALVVLVIGLGWLNHSGQPDEGGTSFGRDVSQAIERAETLGEIPGSEPATPSAIGSGRGATGRDTPTTTVVTDPETGLRVTVAGPGGPGTSPTTGDTTAAAGPGTTGTTSGSSGSGGTTGTTAGSGTTDPPPTSGSTSPPGPSTTPPPTTAPPTSAPPTTPPPTGGEGGLVGGVLDGVLGVLGL